MLKNVVHKTLNSSSYDTKRKPNLADKDEVKLHFMLTVNIHKKKYKNYLPLVFLLYPPHYIQAFIGM